MCDIMSAAQEVRVVGISISFIIIIIITWIDWQSLPEYYVLQPKIFFQTSTKISKVYLNCAWYA